MVVPHETVWKIEPHTTIKHLILRQYLNAWLPMMSKYNGRIVFVDGFAGPGRYVGAEPGSPIIALTALLDHRYFQQPRGEREFVFFFIESDEKRVETLREELRRLAKDKKIPPWVKYDAEHGEFAPVMTRILDGLDKNDGILAPTFVFVDPFGFSGAPLKVIARITQNARCECLITFMFDAVNRWLSHPDAEIGAHFDALFGTPQWRALLKEPDPHRRRDAILDLYRRQLQTVAKMKYVRMFEMLNRLGRPIYSLYFGTNSEDGLSRVKEAMWNADPGAGRIFSDRTATDQTVLFQAEPDLTLLQKMLGNQFRGRGWVSIDDVARFVRIDTPFAERMHLKRRTLREMERNDPPKIAVRRPEGARDRPGDYPIGTRIRFL